MVEVFWSQRAIQDLSRIVGFLDAVSPTATLRSLVALRRGVKVIRNSPLAGRTLAGRPKSLRKWIVPFGGSAYVIFYRVTGNVTILRLFHGREAGL